MSVQIPDGYLVVPGRAHSCEGCAFDQQNLCPGVGTRQTSRSCVALEVELKCPVVFVKTPESWMARNGIRRDRIVPVKEEGPNESACL